MGGLIGFVIGLTLGGCFGFVCAALCMASGRRGCEENC